MSLPARILAKMSVLDESDKYQWDSTVHHCHQYPNQITGIWFSQAKCPHTEQEDDKKTPFVHLKMRIICPNSMFLLLVFLNFTPWNSYSGSIQPAKLLYTWSNNFYSPCYCPRWYFIQLVWKNLCMSRRNICSTQNCQHKVKRITHTL